MIKVFIDLGPSCDFSSNATFLHQFWLGAKTTNAKLGIRNEYLKQLDDWINVDCTQTLIEKWSEIESTLIDMGVNIDWAENMETDFLLDHGSYSDGYIDPFDPDLDLVGNLPYNFTGIIKVDGDIPPEVVSFLQIMDMRIETI